MVLRLYQDQKMISNCTRETFFLYYLYLVGRLLKLEASDETVWSFLFVCPILSTSNFLFSCSPDSINHKCWVKHTFIQYLINERVFIKKTYFFGPGSFVLFPNLCLDENGKNPDSQNRRQTNEISCVGVGITCTDLCFEISEQPEVLWCGRFSIRMTYVFCDEFSPIKVKNNQVYDCPFWRPKKTRLSTTGFASNFHWKKEENNREELFGSILGR